MTTKPTANAHDAAAPARRSYIGMTGAKIFHEMLQEEGVEVIFGFPGGVVLPIFDALYKSPIKFILTRHEQGAAHMADGYARATGKVGRRAGHQRPRRHQPGDRPGHRLHGLASRWSPSPARSSSYLIGNDAFQEADMTGITRPITKHNFLVKRRGRPGRGRSARRSTSPAPAGPGRCWWTSPMDATAAKLDGRAGPGDGPARLQAAHGRAHPPDQAGRRGDQRRPAPGAVRRRRGRSSPAPASSCARSADKGQHPRHHHAAGPGRLRRDRPAGPAHAGHARHGLRQLRRAGLRLPHRRRRAVRRPRHRQRWTPSPPRPRSSTSTSTRRASPRTSRWTSPSSATPRTSWRGCWSSSSRATATPWLEQIAAVEGASTRCAYDRDGAASSRRR